MKNNIARILKGIKEEKPERVSVAETIDDACSKGVASTGAFSLLGIKRHLKQMIKSLDDEDFNREDFFREFFKAYSLVMAPDKRAEGVFHPSQLLDGCTRCMAYDIAGVEPTDRCSGRISGALQRTFDVGTWYHLYIQNILYATGLLQQAEVPVVNREKFLNGKADGVFKEEVFGEKVVLEIKTMNSWTFTKAIYHPFKKHEFQASLYARELGARKVLYLYINKDTSEIREFLEPVNEEQLAIADKKMAEAISYTKDKKPPRRSCRDRYSDNALNCPFATLCFSEK